jgi:hypothetical protein
MYRLVVSPQLPFPSRLIEPTIQINDLSERPGRFGMDWARMLAYVTGPVDHELLLRNEYLAAENRILRAQIKTRLQFSDAERATLAEITRRP